MKCSNCGKECFAITVPRTFSNPISDYISVFSCCQADILLETCSQDSYHKVSSYQTKDISHVCNILEKRICYICKKSIDNFNANPDKWAVGLPYKNGNGEKRYYCIECLTELISKYYP